MTDDEIEVLLIRELIRERDEALAARDDARAEREVTIAENTQLSELLAERLAERDEARAERDDLRDKIDVFKRHPVYVGLDLSARADQTAVVFACRDDDGFRETQATVQNS